MGTRIKIKKIIALLLTLSLILCNAPYAEASYGYYSIYDIATGNYDKPFDYYTDTIYDVESSDSGKYILQVIDRIKEIISEWDVENLTDFEKVKLAYEWVVENVEYGGASTSSAYDAIIGGKATCVGISGALDCFLKVLGFDGVVVHGEVTEGHAWNMVKLGEYYYFLDASSNGKLIYEYGYPYNFLVSESWEEARNRVLYEGYNTADFAEEYPMAKYAYDDPSFDVEIPSYSLTTTKGEVLTSEDGIATVFIEPDMSLVEKFGEGSGDFSFVLNTLVKIGIDKINDVRIVVVMPKEVFGYYNATPDIEKLSDKIKICEVDLGKYIGSYNESHSEFIYYENSMEDLSPIKEIRSFCWQQYEDWYEEHCKGYEMRWGGNRILFIDKDNKLKHCYRFPYSRRGMYEKMLYDLAIDMGSQDVYNIMPECTPRPPLTPELKYELDYIWVNSGSNRLFGRPQPVPTPSPTPTPPLYVEEGKYTVNSYEVPIKDIEFFDDGEFVYNEDGSLTNNGIEPIFVPLRNDHDYSSNDKIDIKITGSYSETVVSSGMCLAGKKGKNSYLYAYPPTVYSNGEYKTIKEIELNNTFRIGLNYEKYDSEFQELVQNNNLYMVFKLKSGTDPNMVRLQNKKNYQVTDWIDSSTITEEMLSDYMIVVRGKPYPNNFRIEKVEVTEYLYNGDNGEPRPTYTPAPTGEPTASPTVKPTSTPTPRPTASPTVKPTATPTVKPTASPTPRPTVTPTVKPTESPTSEPTTEPTTEPTKEPTSEPTTEPTEEPTKEPTEEPTTEPPTETPKATPTPVPHAPTSAPAPVASPTPTVKPTPVPTPMPKLAITVSNKLAGKKKITGKINKKGATVRIKVGKKAYRKAKVYGYKFFFNVSTKLKRRTKITIKADKRGCKGASRSFKVR